jgi:hypothetical protein
MENPPKADGILLLKLAAQMEEVLERLDNLEKRIRRVDSEQFRLDEAFETVLSHFLDMEDRDGEMLQ